MKHPAYCVINISITITFFLLIFTACEHDSQPIRTIESFKVHLNKDMSESSLLHVFGNADKDLGSGIHIYQYNMGDGTMVVIGCTDKVLYARHVDAQHNLLETII